MTFWTPLSNFVCFESPPPLHRRQDHIARKLPKHKIFSVSDDTRNTIRPFVDRERCLRNAKYFAFGTSCVYARPPCPRSSTLIHTLTPPPIWPEFFDKLLFSLKMGHPSSPSSGKISWKFLRIRLTITNYYLFLGKILKKCQKSHFIFYSETNKNIEILRVAHPSEFFIRILKKCFRGSKANFIK